MTHDLEFSDVIEGSPQFLQGIRHRHQPQFLIAHICKKLSVKNNFVSSNNMVPGRVIFLIVVHDNPFNPFLHLIRFIWIEECIEVPSQVSIISIFLIGIIKIPRQTLLFYLRLLIDVSQFFQSQIKITPLLCPAYSTSPLLWWGTIKFTLILIIYVVTNEVLHLVFYHLHIPP